MKTGYSFRYHVIIENFTHSDVTVTLKSNMNDSEYTTTLPANGSSKTIERIGKCQCAGNNEIVYAIYCDGIKLDSVSKVIVAEGKQSKPSRLSGGKKFSMDPDIKAALFSIVVLTFVVTVPVFWPQITGLFKGVIPRELTIDGGLVVGADGSKIILDNHLNATDPSYSQLLSFLKVDETENNPYIGGGYILGVGFQKAEYVCADFAETLHNNAEAAGIKAGYVIINKTHALNLFNTTDRGIVHIDVILADCIAHVMLGEEYTLQPIWPENKNNIYESPVGTVTDIKTFW